jgi:hypothetical protein
MNAHEDRSTGIGERRRSTRRDVDLEIEVQLGSQSVHGRAENISSAGIFLFSGEPLRVTVRVSEEGDVKTFPGRLVRVERLSPETTGYAVEFDRL